MIGDLFSSIPYGFRNPVPKPETPAPSNFNKRPSSVVQQEPTRANEKLFSTPLKDHNHHQQPLPSSSGRKDQSKSFHKKGEPIPLPPLKTEELKTESTSSKSASKQYRKRSESSSVSWNQIFL